MDRDIFQAISIFNDMMATQTYIIFLLLKRIHLFNRFKYL